MKSQLKVNRVGSWMFFVVAVALALSFLGCPGGPKPSDPVSIQDPEERVVTRDITRDVTVPLMTLTDDIIARVGGIEEMQKAHFFVSNVITMRLGEIKQEYMVIDGKVVRTSDIYAENVRIEPSYEGETQNYQERTDPPYGFQLNIVFKKAGGNLEIPFVKQGYGANERYEISIDAEKKINFGGAIYTVSYGGEDRNETPPYLLFKIEDRIRSR